MRVPNVVLAAKCSDRWIGLRSPVTSAKPITSEEEMVLENFSVMPTARSSKNKVRKASMASCPPRPRGGQHCFGRRPARRVRSIVQHRLDEAGRVAPELAHQPIVLGVLDPRRL